MVVRNRLLYTHLSINQVINALVVEFADRGSAPTGDTPKITYHTEISMIPKLRSPWEPNPVWANMSLENVAHALV